MTGELKKFWSKSRRPPVTRVTELCITILTLHLLLAGCTHRSAPRPRGYFRIDLPEKTYHKVTPAGLPLRFKIPDYSCFTPYSGTLQEDSLNHFFNLEFPQFHSRLYLTYIRIHGNLPQLIEDAHKFAYKHTIVADAIGQTRYENPENHVFGILFDIKGNAASSVQFFVTDSTRNFFRGSLYFDTEPNKDSLAPVISFLRKDVRVLMESLEWLN